MLNIGVRIRRLRERKDWTQKKLSGKVGINQSVFNRIESGERKVRSEELTRIAESLDVSNDYLLGITDDPQRYNDKETTIHLIEDVATRRGYRIDDPDFLKILSNAFDIIDLAKGKDRN